MRISRKVEPPRTPILLCLKRNSMQRYVANIFSEHFFAEHNFFVRFMDFEWGTKMFCTNSQQFWMNYDEHILCRTYSEQNSCRTLLFCSVYGLNRMMFGNQIIFCTKSRLFWIHEQKLRAEHIFFVRSFFNEDFKDNPGQKINFGDFSKLCGQKWQQMDETDREEFEEKANEVPINHRYSFRCTSGFKILKFL